MRLVTHADIHFNQENTPISDQFDDVYFSNQDGLEESRYVFQQGNQLWQRWQKHEQAYFIIAETGFGTGLIFWLPPRFFASFANNFHRQHYNGYFLFPLKNIR